MWRLLLGTMGVRSLVQGLNSAATAGFEPRTVWSEVRRRNRLATAPPVAVQRHYYRVGSHLNFKTGQNETFQSVPELSGTYRSCFDVKAISSITSEDFSEVYWYSGLQALFVTVLQTSVDLLCKKSYKGSSLLGYFDCFLSNHTVGCCNINFSCLSQSRRENFLLCQQCLYISVVLFWVTVVASMPHLANFSPCDPQIFSLASLFILIACWKTNFSRMFMGNYWERNREREMFRLNRFPTFEAKRYYTVLRSKSNFFFFQFPPGIAEKQSKKKQAYCWLKNKEPGKRNGTFWTLILMFIFHEKCQSLGHVKVQNLPCNTPLFLVFWPHPEPL